ncbi:MAG: alanine--tRNA ligase [Pelolinea sp.]|nr:alanine--tRNA ligase [Pelolinea sp.]
MSKLLSGNQIRQEFIDYFTNKGHQFVPSSSIVPGGDQTLLFTNAGMVQFKDVFLGTDKRNYTRAVNSQKCMRVAGKHNDLDDVGRDDLHHTFFEMLGNWSFGDYYKKEAITWAWELLTQVWGLDKSRIWVTCFKDEKGQIETDQEAADNWQLQPGIDPDHILFFGRKDNFWEMADNGPCGPCSEIHFDKGPEYCDKQHDPKHKCGVNSDCHRYLELWNLVFIQYNRTSPTNLDPLPARHVDTGMGFERIVSVLQGVDSNYRTDLLFPLIEMVRQLSGHSEKERDQNFTPYRVVADHARAASFLIAEGVVPGNVGRNYICRMIIRRASRFGSKLDLNEPFLGKIAEKVIEQYGQAYPELVKNQKTIIDNLTREEKRFETTVESGLSHLEDAILDLNSKGKTQLDGKLAFDLYATHGLPLEITRDVLREKSLEVDQKGFFDAMEEHRINSGAGKEFGPLGGEDAEFYSSLGEQLKIALLLDNKGVEYDPYTLSFTESEIVGLVYGQESAQQITEGQEAGVILSKTGFYIESGGQVSDLGVITSENGKNIFEVEEVRKPAPGIIVHFGKVKKGKFSAKDQVFAEVDQKRRQDIMRNHTATHLLHTQLRKVLGEHVRQAGSLVAPDRLRFDFTHPSSLTPYELRKVEDGVNQEILNNYPLTINQKKLSQALEEGAMALFGEKYGEEVRTISIGGEKPFSYELCGGTHVGETSEIGTFILTSEGSVAAGIRRIEAVTGRKAYQIISKRLQNLSTIKNLFGCSLDEVVPTAEKILSEKDHLIKELAKFGFLNAKNEYQIAKSNARLINGKSVVTLLLQNSTVDTMRELADSFRQDFSSGIAVIANVDGSGNIQLISTVTDDMVKKGANAGTIINKIAGEIGGSGGGRPQLAQGGGTNLLRLKEIFENIQDNI